MRQNGETGSQTGFGEKSLEEKEENRRKREKARIPFTPLSPANLLRNKLTSVSTLSPHSLWCRVCSLCSDIF